MVINQGDIIKFNKPTWAREDSDKNSRKIDIADPQKQYEVKEVNEDWIKTDAGWSPLLSRNIMVLAATDTSGGTSSDGTATASDTSTTDTTTTQKKEAPEQDDKEVLEAVKQEWQNFSKINLSNGNTIKGNMLKNINGIFGIPYQFMDTVDRKLPGTDFGYLYSDKIVARMPLLLMSPGRPNFMSNYTRGSVKDYIKGIITGDKSKLEEITNAKDGQLYTFSYNFKDYYDTVNKMCSVVSRLLKIDGYEVYGQKLGNFRWDTFVNGQLSSFIQAIDSVAFYVDAETQIGESFQNTTKDSMLSSTINSVSEMGQELQFLLGGVGGMVGKQFDKLKADNYDATMKEINSFTDKYASVLPKNLVDTLGQSITTIIGGGKMAFPEIWSDSNIGRNYEISIKLRTPDPNNLSWFLDIAVPMIHLIAFAAPQQMGGNSYRSPFLVRAYYKGFFNCQMGIISSMSIQRGDKAQWTINGLPTEVNINFSIKDLYDYLNISSFGKGIVDMFKNTALIDYLAVMCGININKPDILRTIDLYKLSAENGLKDLITFDRFMGVRQSISNLAAKLWH